MLCHQYGKKIREVVKMEMENESLGNNEETECTPPYFIDRYFESKYKIDCKGKKREDFCILKHSNKICVLTVAKSHPIFDAGREITQVDFQISESVNRLENSVTGKGKKGGQWLDEFSPICRVHCSDGSMFTMTSCIKGKLIEVNKRLIKEPQLLQKQPQTDGFFAIILMKLQVAESEMQSLLSQEEYDAAILNRDPTVTS